MLRARRHSSEFLGCSRAIRRNDHLSLARMLRRAMQVDESGRVHYLWGGSVPHFIDIVGGLNP